MNKVKNGLYVRVGYTGSLENGDIFDSTEGQHPLEVHVGAGQVIEGFEKALLGMALQDKKVFTLAPQEAYGSRNEKLVHIISRSEFPPEIIPQVGTMIGLRGSEGRSLPAQIVHVDDENLTLDLNHPLAGQALTFEIEVLGISATPTQAPAGCHCDCNCSADS